MTTLQSLESAAFAAWPSRHSLDVNGWQLRLDRGYTQRANSANATERAQPLTDGDIDAIESRFREHGLPPVFRLPSFAPIEATDALLARRGYVACDPSLVMTRALSDEPHPSNTWFADDATAWLDAFQAVSGQGAAHQAIHLDILRRIEHPCAWAVKGPDGAPQCAGLGVRVGSTLGLFDIATHVDHRRRGLAGQLCRGLLAWGRDRGASIAFLQVAQANRPAIGLYERLGFQVAYGYRYRTRTGSPRDVRVRSDAAHLHR